MLHASKFCHLLGRKLGETRLILGVVVEIKSLAYSGNINTSIQPVKFVSHLPLTKGKIYHSMKTYTVEPLITDTAGEFKFCPL
jgi:hypothetical protein